MKYYQSKYNIYKIINNRYFLFNSLTKGLIELDEKFYKALKKNNFDEIEKPVLQMLIKEKYLVNALYETELFKYEINKIKNKNKTLSLVIAPTMNCNFACSYCFEKHSNIFMSTKTINKISNFVKEKYKKVNFKKLSVTWYGGEPTLAINIIDKLSKLLISFCKNNDIKYISNMITNGFLLDDKVLKKLKQLKVYDYQITIDGPPLIHDTRRKLINNKPTFNVILNNLKNINENHGKIKVNIRINIDKTNYNHIVELLTILKKSKLTNFSISLGHVQSFTEICKTIETTCLSKDEYLDKLFDFALLLKENGFNDFISLLEIPKRIIYCGAIMTNSYVIDSDGYFYKCWNDVGVKEEAIFNVHYKQNDTQLLNELKYLNYNSLEYKKCLACLGFPICLGGCPYTNLKNKEPKCYNFDKEVEFYIKGVMKGETYENNK